MSAAAEVSGAKTNARPRVGFIVGPTGSGKSALAIKVAERINAEIVNADSRLFYRGMDIGAAKPSEQERSRVAHHLIDIRRADEPLDAAAFSLLARAAIEDIVRRGKRPLVTGGSGLYLRALRHGIFAGPPAASEYRKCLRDLATKRGAAWLHDKLREVDPASAARIGRNDLSRITRALEVFHVTGIPLSLHHVRHAFADTPYETLLIAIDLDRAQLYAAIGRRFDAMLAAGLVQEVKRLLDDGCRVDRQPLSAIGYRQIAAYLAGEMTLETASALAKRDTRRLAKRQLTWFRAEPDIVWLRAEIAERDAATTFERFFATGIRPQFIDSGPASDGTRLAVQA